MRGWRWLFFWIGCAVALTGCAGAKPVFQLESTARSSALTVTLTELDAQALLSSWASSSQPAWLFNPRIDLTTGGMTIRGQVRDAGGKLIPTTATALIAVNEGWLTLRVNGFVYGTYNSSAADLAKINKDIAAGLATARTQNIKQFRFESLVISDSGLSIKLSAPTPSGLNAVFQLDSDAQYNYLTIGLAARDVRAILNSVFAAGERPWFLNPVITFGNGQIGISGSLLEAATGKTTAISFILGLRAQNGRLILSIPALNLGGYQVPDSILESVNKGIADAALRAQGATSIELLTITPNGITVRLRLPR